MSFVIKKSQSDNKSTITPVIKSQRSSCAVRIFRFDNVNNTEILRFNIAEYKFIKSPKENVLAKTDIIITNDITTCSISQSKTSHLGSFSITLKKGTLKNNTGKGELNYVNDIHPGDWIAIYLKKSGEITDSDLKSTKPESGFKFLGTIDNVRLVESDNIETGVPRLDYLITGSSFGKVFESSIFFNPVIPNAEGQTVNSYFKTEYLEKLQKSSFSADVLAKLVIDFILGGRFNLLASISDSWYIPNSLGKILKPKSTANSGGVSFIDVLNTSRIGLHKVNQGKFLGVTKLLGETSAFSMPGQGTLWSFLQYFQNDSVNELFTELVEDSNKNLMPAVVFRQCPFSSIKNHSTSVAYNSPNFKDSVSDSEKTFFVHLPRFEIKSTDIFIKNVGKSDHERINYISLTSSFSGSSEEKDKTHLQATVNAPSIQKYGLKPLQKQTAYVFSTGAISGDAVSVLMIKHIDLITDWFFLSHNLYNGTLLIDGSDNYIRVGDNLYISDIKQLFHIEAYTHNYQLRGDGVVTFTTEVQVSRGQAFDAERNKSAFLSEATINEPTSVVVSYFRNGSR